MDTENRTPAYQRHAERAAQELEIGEDLWDSGDYEYATERLAIARSEALVSLAQAMIVVVRKLDVIIARQMGKLGK